MLILANDHSISKYLKKPTSKNFLKFYLGKIKSSLIMAHNLLCFVL